MCISDGPPRGDARLRDSGDDALRAIRQALMRGGTAPERVLAEIGEILGAAGYGPLAPPGLDEDLFARLWWGEGAP